MPYNDIEKRRATQRAWYAKNKETESALARQRHAKARKRNKDILDEIRQTTPCLDCGEDNPIVLDFDHIKGEKINHVTTMAAEGASVKRLKEEISKCEVVCANCHRIRTHNRRNESESLRGQNGKGA